VTPVVGPGAIDEGVSSGVDVSAATSVVTSNLELPATAATSTKNPATPPSAIHTFALRRQRNRPATALAPETAGPDGNLWRRGAVVRSAGVGVWSSSDHRSPSQYRSPVPSGFRYQPAGKMFEFIRNLLAAASCKEKDNQAWHGMVWS